MERTIPQTLLFFLKNGIRDVEDGYEYSSELNRILNSDDCQRALSGREMELLKEFSEKVKKIGEITYYSEERIKEIEHDMFGNSGISGFLGIAPQEKPKWPF